VGAEDGAVRSIALTLSFPPRELSPNYRSRHWTQVARAKKAYRTECMVDARNARDCRTEYPLRAPVEAHVVFVVGARDRLPDVDNCLASLKAGIDGVCDAGVITDDRDIASWHVSVARGHKREVSLLLREVRE
jgi:Holliday junction resolvase RusA-like endonuclease